MLKFFRRIRGDLIKGGNVNSYFLYAIGEILLVMIGILLALQVNNWNQNRINKNTQVKLLHDLENEFITNIDRIDSRLKLRMGFSEAIENYLRLIADGSTTYEDWLALSEVRMGGGNINPSLGVLNALITTGNLNLINNDSLKYLLADWNDQMGDLSENEEIYNYHIRNLLEYNAHNFPHKWYRWKGWPKDRLQKNYAEASSDIEYWNRLVYVQGNVTNVAIITERKLINANRILALIREELENMK